MSAWGKAWGRAWGSAWGRTASDATSPGGGSAWRLAPGQEAPPQLDGFDEAWLESDDIGLIVSVASAYRR